MSTVILAMHVLTSCFRRARPAGFEPATRCLEGSCSVRLSYGRPETVLAGLDHASATYGSQCVATSALTDSPVYEVFAGLSQLRTAQPCRASSPHRLHPRIGPRSFAQSAAEACPARRSRRPAVPASALVSRQRGGFDRRG